jgi:hypothetical protein
MAARLAQLHGCDGTTDVPFLRNRMGKVQHWRGVWSIFGLKGSPMLDFVVFERESATTRSPPVDTIGSDTSR